MSRKTAALMQMILHVIPYFEPYYLEKARDLLPGIRSTISPSCWTCTYFTMCRMSWRLDVTCSASAFHSLLLHLQLLKINLDHVHVHLLGLYVNVKLLGSTASLASVTGSVGLHLGILICGLLLGPNFPVPYFL